MKTKRKPARKHPDRHPEGCSCARCEHARNAPSRPRLGQETVESVARAMYSVCNPPYEDADGWRCSECQEEYRRMARAAIKAYIASGKGK